MDLYKFVIKANQKESVFTMLYNYHTHTYRCSHASGTPEEYIQRAIQCGIKYMGFSDHAPFVFPDGYESSYRVPAADAGTYVSELRFLREKYKNEIDVKIGFEMEYYPTHFENMLKTAVEAGGEYLILGQHFIREEHPGGTHVYSSNDLSEDWEEYISCVIAAMESGVFTYVAHPDIFHFTGDAAVYQAGVRRICSASRSLHIPLEINCLGIRDNRHYPNEAFWEIAGQEKAPVTIGFDAHDIQSAFDCASVLKANMLIEKYDLNYIGMPTLIPINKAGSFA